MQDAITNVINKSDVQGLYLDTASMTNLESYFASGELRVRAAATISANASAIIRDAVAKGLAKDFGNIVAIKEASGNLDQITEILMNRPDGFQVISGDDNLTLHMMLLGGEGVISVSGQGVPEVFCSMVDAALDGDFYTAREAHLALFELTNLLFAEGNPAGIKSLLNLRGICGDAVRLPLIPASSELRNQLAAELTQLQL